MSARQAMRVVDMFDVEAGHGNTKYMTHTELHEVYCTDMRALVASGDGWYGGV